MEIQDNVRGNKNYKESKIKENILNLGTATHGEKPQSTQYPDVLLLKIIHARHNEIANIIHVN